MSMDSSSFEGVGVDPSKCSKMSMEEKRELVYELAKRSHGASQMLQWTRQEILQILCVELGKERKYTGLTKLKIIENLLKVVSEKNSGEREVNTEAEPLSSPSSSQRTSKRQRKTENPSRLPVPVNEPAINNGGNDIVNAIYCKNSACRANLRVEDAFCKRCSCCICHQYDDNKDPSLWLTCSSEPPFGGESCGMSCHLECALKIEKSGIGKGRCFPGLDGSFYCVSCGKVNDLLGCWRKQLMVAKDTRRVDILCYRVSLGQKLLNGTDKYQNLSKIVDDAVEMLEAEVGPLTGVPVKMGRGIVNRLSSGPEIQKLCAFALQSLEETISSTILPSPAIKDSNLIVPNMVRVEDVCATSLTVVLGSEDPSPGTDISYSLWHRKAHEDYPVRPTCTLFARNPRFVVTGLTPATEYQFKVVSLVGTTELGKCEVWFSTGSIREDVTNCSIMERSHSPATNCSSLSNPSSVEDESNNITPDRDQNDDRVNDYFNYCKDTDKVASANLSDDAVDCAIVVEGATPADAISLLEEERAINIDGSVPDSDVRKLENKHPPEGQFTEEMSTDNGLDNRVPAGMECVPYVGTSEASLPITPCKIEILKDGQGRNARSKSSNKDLENGIGKGDEPRDNSTSKKRSAERRDEECTANGASDFEHCVKVIRCLECEGHIERNFRQKFLTWYSLRATSQEVRIVKVFIDTFVEDPASLAEQLVDTFSDCISSKRASVVPAGFCMKLWH
ncbi:VIN3-like protein 2 [Pistacia vera]|uniref:VIN3-like protein 2 n=1 Tax=Pistacia vera TaxID=55513 RepID=UPI001262CADA|nr:VIN3-like protein 2 [Pistacia vera]